MRRLAHTGPDGRRQSATPAETQRAEDDRQIVQMLEDVVPVQLRDGSEVMHGGDEQDRRRDDRDPQGDTGLCALQDP